MPRLKKSNRADGRYALKRLVGHDLEGKAIYKWFYGEGKQDAENKYTLFLLDLQKKEEERKTMPFEKWAEEWLYTYKEPDVKGSTFNSTYYRPVMLHLIPHFKGQALRHITQADIKRYFNINKERSLSTLQKDLLCLKGIYETAIDNELVEKNPCRNIKIKSAQDKQKKRTYSQDTVDKLCVVNHKYALIINMLLKLGLRASELCGLKWENVDLINKSVYICNTVTKESGIVYEGKPKTDNSARVLPLDDSLITLLQNEPKNGLYVINTDGARNTPEKLYIKLRTFYAYLGIPKELRLSPHELRHTCGTLLYKETKDIYHVSKFLGHSDISITSNIYVHSEFQDKEIHL
jgi:integrase